MRYQVDPTKIDLKERKRMVFKDFMGVDALSPVFSISNKRASKMCNLISRDGSNHKRYGWEQYLQFDGAINGVFRFTINQTRFDVVYAGTTFWMKKYGEDTYTAAQSCAYITDTRDLTLLRNQECKCYIQKDRAYFIGCGDFLVFAYDSESETYRFARVVDDKDTYIPTTTENISCEEQDLDGNNNPISYGARQTGEDVNILNKTRRNTIIGSQVSNSRTYQLDLLNTETIEPQSIRISGYDYDASNGTKGNIFLKAKSNQSNIYAAVTNNMGLDTLNGKIVIPKNTNMPLPTGFGIENKVTIGKGKYVSNNVVIYSYAIDYYQLTYTTNYSDIFGNTHYRHAIEANVVITITGNGQTITQEYESFYYGKYLGSSLPTEPSRLYNQNTIVINIENLFSSIGVNLQNKISNDVAATETIAKYFETYDVRTDVVNDTTLNYLYYEQSAIQLVSSVDATDNTTYGYLWSTTGKLELDLYARSIAGEPNLTITFSVSGKTDYRKITESKLSTLFGIGGNALALFVSGFEDEQHKDWWSKELDYTYFPSGFECAVGTGNTAIVGYQVLGDSSLAIFKEYTEQEPSVYIRSGTDTNLSQTDDGTISIVTGGYYTAGKYMSKGVIAPKSIALMQGDPMVLTQDGVCALTIDANTSSISNRVFRERSRLIDNIIKNYVGKADAKAYVHDGKYYLCIGSDVYIADSRYTFTLKGDMTDTYNYEWWIWDNCPMHYIFENEDGELCFGTLDGRICKFYKGFEDIKKDTYDVLTFSSVGSNISIYVDENSPNFLEDGEEYYFKTNTPLYAKIEFSYVKEAFASYYDGKIVRKVVNGEVDEDNEYRLSIEKDAESQVWSSKIINTDTLEESNVSLQDTIVLDIRNTRFKVYKNNNSSYLVASELYDAADGSSSYLNIYKWRGCYNYSISVDRQIDIVHIIAQNVAAYWYSPALDFGTNDYEKVMLYVTIATERHTNGQVIFGWETREIEAEITSKGMDTFDFEEVNFNRIALDTTWNTSYTRNLKCNFNFIMFRFESDNDVDCCVHQFTIGYKINHKNRGVR